MPAALRLRTIDAGGPIHFADFGGAGTPMVLVHGLGGACENWLAVGGPLAEHARGLAPDLPVFQSSTSRVAISEGGEVPSAASRLPKVMSIMMSRSK
jgi:pimeloyl-ACP methyl ester carboxylesterase